MNEAADALSVARLCDFEVTRADVVFADSDGCLFVPHERVGEVMEIARAIWETERRQATQIEGGQTLREQLKFKDFLEKRSRDAGFTFREHLRAIKGAIEE